MSSPYIPPQTPMPGMGGPPPPKKSKALFMLLGLVALCAVAGAVLVIMTMGDKDSGEAEAEAATDDGKKEVEAMPTESPPPTGGGIGTLALDEVPEITVSLDTVPPNAEVFRKGESVGVTPLTRRFEKGTGTETWQLFLDGYQVEEIDVEMDADFHSEVVLTKLADDAPSVARPTASNTGDKSSGDRDSGDKKSDKDKKKVRKNDKGTRTVIGTTGASLPD